MLRRGGAAAVVLPSAYRCRLRPLCARDSFVSDRVGPRKHGVPRGGGDAGKGGQSHDVSSALLRRGARRARRVRGVQLPRGRGCRRRGRRSQPRASEEHGPRQRRRRRPHREQELGARRRERVALQRARGAGGGGQRRPACGGQHVPREPERRHCVRRVRAWDVPGQHHLRQFPDRDGGDAERAAAGAVQPCARQPRRRDRRLRRRRGRLPGQLGVRQHGPGLRAQWLVAANL
mmetsp:Transcript_20041/g.65305  ORF Transcript_20041/g.65305 Transcript_20041/m.65305 type:complete len:233 (-) Transcript_20041:452-1150(-)